MNQEPPAYSGQYESQATAPVPLTKEQVYPQLVVTETPSKPHSYDDDTTTPMKPHAYDETPGQAPPPSYPVAKPNTFEKDASEQTLEKSDSKRSSFSQGSYKIPLQAKNSSRSAPMPHNPKVGSHLSNLSDDEESTSRSGFFGAFQRKASVKKDGPRDPLTQLPDCFDRQPEFSSTPRQFTTFYIPCQGKYLDNGFPKAFPSAQLASHDIYAQDWARFLEDVATMGRLTGGQKIVSSVFPVTMYVGFTGYHITKAIERGMKKGKHSKVASLVDIWNAVFFNQRGINVVLMRGSKRISGPPIESESSYSSQSSSSSSSLSSPQSLPLSSPEQTSSSSQYNPGPAFPYDAASSLAHRKSMESLSSMSSATTSASSPQKAPGYMDMLSPKAPMEGGYREPERLMMPQIPLLPKMSQLIMPQMPATPQMPAMPQEEFLRNMSRGSSRRERRHDRYQERQEKKVDEKYYMMVEYREPGV